MEWITSAEADRRVRPVTTGLVTVTTLEGGAFWSA